MAAITSTVLAVAAVAGVGLTAVGAYEQYQGAQRAAEASQQTIGLEQQNEATRQKAMELDARRKSLEAIRNQQRARSVALANATSQGAGLGSGLQGGYGQIAGQTGTNLLGVAQNLELGQATFDVNALISQQRIAASQAGTQAAFGGGLSSLGGSIVSSLPAIRGLSGGISPYRVPPIASSTSYTA